MGVLDDGERAGIVNGDWAGWIDGFFLYAVSRCLGVHGDGLSDLGGRWVFPDWLWWRFAPLTGEDEVGGRPQNFVEFVFEGLLVWRY